MRERELGSLESLMTMPIGASDLVIGKMAPYIVVAAIDVALVILVSGLVFGNWPRGSVLALSSFTLLFLLGNLVNEPLKVCVVITVLVLDAFPE